MDANWDDLKTVLAVVRLKTLAAAGHALGVNYTTIARRVTRAETALGVLLFERLADGYVPTPQGEDVARYAAEMEERAHALMRHLSGQARLLPGPLTITAPQLLISTLLAPMIDDFLTLHPDIDLTVRATNDLLDLSRREADLAIRISSEPGDSLTGLRLTHQYSASFAAPELARRIQDSPKGQIDWVLHSSADAPPKASLEQYPNARVRIRFDDMVAIIGAAQAGLGVARLPLFLGRHSGGLVQVPVLPPQPYPDIWVVAHRDVWKSARVAAFKSALVTFFKANRHRFVPS